MAQNYYQRLGVSTTANTAQIKSAFRSKIKAVHPDLKGGIPHEAFEVHQLIEAYEVLSDPSSRLAYDNSLRKSFEENKSDFNYRDWLLSRDDDESQAKLIFYDSLRDRTPEALERFLTLQKNDSFSLEKILGKEDFMDCGFMLALELESMGNSYQALSIFLRLSQLESQRAYFRHFYVEVEERIIQILLRKGNQIPTTKVIQIIEECMLFPFKDKNKALLLKKQSELYLTLGQGILAKSALERSRRFKN